MRKASLIGILLFVTAVTVPAQETGLSFTIPSARTAAVGGLHAAVTDDLSSLFSNPAGFISAEPQISLAELSIGMSGPIFDIAGLVIQGMNQDITTLLGSDTVQTLINTLYAASNIIGPINFGYLGGGLAFGFFNTTDVTFVSNAPLTVTAIAGEQVTLAGGYAFRIPFSEESASAFDIGLLLKGSLRGEVSLSLSLLELSTLFSTIGVDTVTGEPFSLVSAIGVDVGIRYSYDDVFALGIVGKDLYTPTMTQPYSTLDGFLSSTGSLTPAYGLEPIDLTAGFMISPRLGRLQRFIDELILTADYVDILDFLTHPESAVNPILHAGIGAELRMLGIMAIRGGFNQGLFAAGLGLDLTIFGINIAMFGTELTSEPGIRPAYNATIGIEFRL